MNKQTNHVISSAVYVLVECDTIFAVLQSVGLDKVVLAISFSLGLYRQNCFHPQKSNLCIWHVIYKGFYLF